VSEAHPHSGSNGIANGQGKPVFLAAPEPVPEQKPSVKRWLVTMDGGRELIVYANSSSAAHLRVTRFLDKMAADQRRTYGAVKTVTHRPTDAPPRVVDKRKAPGS
jgi:hypothetical protein